MVAYTASSQSTRLNANELPPRSSPFRWSVARLFATSRLPQVSAFIPAIGYALLWSDEFGKWLASHGTLGDGILIRSIDAKLQLLWWGAVFMSAGWVLFLVRCPPVIQRHASSSEAAIAHLTAPNLFLLKAMAATITKRIGTYSGDMPTGTIVFGLDKKVIAEACSNVGDQGVYDPARVHQADVVLQIQYELDDHCRPASRTCSLGLLSFGAFLFLCPSADVFLRVLRKLVGFE